MHCVSKDLSQNHHEINQRNSTICIDVRSTNEYNTVRINNTKNIPIDQIIAHRDELSKYDTVYINCASGMRSSSACLALTQMGLTNVVNVEGGIGACLNAQLPLT
ncbi:rhodanese [Candidatus Peregrinibacteria bacterium CG11_big_fil_rev_8_21_14_0_20_41_10]|nr:MAG: rhodanese [Candidatus Peregrinibacteria bacterium CG11_big_fil_rev_8_21_14_0_20_41_10]PIZ77227.1 MAG: rhodanese [Candidatus Peregrinibacteria bacterium CG_4_10_14_0_2_um_filter_41_8]PJC37592.1 MAG: rhodanese [Candidatus Peregrinibacteria bacterium CG_4_9_14_0_2_um_filter_41_14]